MSTSAKLAQPVEISVSDPEERDLKIRMWAKQLQLIKPVLNDQSDRKCLHYDSSSYRMLLVMPAFSPAWLHQAKYEYELSKQTLQLWSLDLAAFKFVLERNNIYKWIRSVRSGKIGQIK